jgi:hypothetical protein
MALAMLFAGASEGHALVQQAVVADDAGFTDHHPHAVIDEHSMANLGTRVDFHPREKPGQLTQQPWQQGNLQPPQAVADPMNHQGVEAGIAEQDFQRASGRGIPLPNEGQIGSHGLEDVVGRPHQTARRPISLRN